MIELKMAFGSFEELQHFLTKHALCGALPVLKSGITPGKIAAAYEKAIEIGMAEESKTDFNAVKTIILDLSKSKGREAAIGILKNFQDIKGQSCEKVTAVKEADYAELIKLAKAAL